MKPIRIGSVIFIIIIILGISFGLIYFVYSRYILIHNQISYGFLGQPTTFNPIAVKHNSSDQMISKLLYRSLIKFDDSFKPIGDLVDSWELSEDQKTYTLHLKPNQFWQDKTLITADDVSFTFQSIQNNQEYLNNYPFMSGVQIGIIDQYTMNISINDIYSPFISLLDFGIIPKHIWENISNDRLGRDINNIKTVSSTQYSISSFTMANNLINNIQITSVNSNQPQIIIKYFNNSDELTVALKNGNVDALIDSDSSFSMEFSSYPNFDRYFVPICGETISLYFNLTNKDSFTSNLNFRHLFAELITKTTNNTITQSLPQDHWAFISDNLNPTNTDIDSLIEQLKSIITDKTISIVSANDQRSKGIVNDLKSVLTINQIVYNIQTLSISEIQTNILPERKFDLLLVPQLFNKDPDQYVFWHSTQVDPIYSGLNLSGYSDRRMDKALEIGRKSFDINERKTQYQIMQERLNKDLPAIFISFPTLTSYIRINHPTLNTSGCLWDLTDYFDKFYN